MLKYNEPLNEFDFFVDEDVRARRVGILCMEKHITAALTQALFRVKENAMSFHNKKIQSSNKLSPSEKREKVRHVSKQIREVKWSSLNLMRSFIAQNFIEQFFHYWAKGPLPITFFNVPFIDNHFTTINNAIPKIIELNIDRMNQVHYSRSILFLDSFTTPPKYKIEEKIRDANNLSRCYRIDSRAHDLMQLCDALLGITTYLLEKKRTSSRAKLDLVSSYKRCQKFKKKHSYKYESIYIL